MDTWKDSTIVSLVVSALNMLYLKHERKLQYYVTCYTIARLYFLYITYVFYILLYFLIGWKLK